jgi:hypothetical protein
MSETVLRRVFDLPFAIAVTIASQYYGLPFEAISTEPL